MKNEIITNRLHLRIVEKTDINNIHHLRTHPEVSKYIKRELNKTMQDIEEFIELRKKTDFFYIIQTINKKEFAGAIALWNINREQNYSELGYELLPEFQNKGIMSEAVKAVLDFAFNAQSFEYIEAYTHKDNISSRRLLEKLMFSLVEDKIDEKNIDNVIYGITKNNHL